MGGDNRRPVARRDLPPATLDDWLAWIEARCPINADDRHHLADRLKWLAPAKLATTSRWYAQTWAKAADAEPEAHRQQNPGRRAANASLVASKLSTLVKATHPALQQKSNGTATSSVSRSTHWMDDTTGEK